MSDSLGTLIHRLSGVYRDPQRVLRDAESLLSSPNGTHLRPTTEPLMLNDGSSTPPVLLLRGTLPMTYRGVTYNIPIDMYLPPPYPLRPPTVFVRPVASMAIKKNHKHVGMDGRVYLPYLHDWRPGTHELRELAVWMSSLFGSEPPCYAKQQNNGHSTNGNPPPYAQATNASSHTSSQYTSVSGASYNQSKNSANATNAEEETKRKALEKEIAEANRAAEVARQASLEEKRMKEVQQQTQRQHEETLNSMRARATSKVQFEMTKLLTGKLREELRLEMKNQKQLDGGKEQIEKILTKGEEQKKLLEKGHEEIDEVTMALEKWLAAVKAEEKHSAVNSNTKGVGTGEAKADLIALPADTHSAQMLALSAENAAIDDCVYFLDRALVRGNIPVEVFLKEVRKLSKRQFMVKAHLIKIAQTRAAEHRRV